MEIGKRLRELRQARGLSQGDIEKRTGLLRCYISRVENGHTVPSLETLEKLARAFDIELYQLFFVGDKKPLPPLLQEPLSRNRLEESLLKRFRAMVEADRRLLLSVARQMARHSGRRRQQASL